MKVHAPYYERRLNYAVLAALTVAFSAILYGNAFLGGVQ